MSVSTVIFLKNIAAWFAICVNVLGLISNFNLFRVRTLQEDEARVWWSCWNTQQGRGCKFHQSFRFCFAFSDTDSHTGYGSASLTAPPNRNNPFGCPECCWLRCWLAYCIHQPASLLFLISGSCFYPFLFATLSLWKTNTPPTTTTTTSSGEGPIKL